MKWPEAVLATLFVFGLGHRIHIRAFRQILQNRVNQETLISLGSIAALLRSYSLMLRGTQNLGFEIPMIIISSYFLVKLCVHLVGRHFPERGSKVSAYFVTGVMVIATLSAGFHYLISDNPDLAFNVFMACLLSVSPWALEIAGASNLHLMALLYNVIALALAAFGFLSPLWASLAMPLSTLCTALLRPRLN